MLTFHLCFRYQTELEAELDSAKSKLAISDIDAKLKEQDEQFAKAKAAYVTAERARYETVFRDAVRSLSSFSIFYSLLTFFGFFLGYRND